MPLPSSSPPALPDPSDDRRDEDWRAGVFCLYVHWPFCAAKCPYCDFNSHVRAGIDQDRWRRALIAEIRSAAEELPGREITSLFFGGGTPSLMPAETVAAVIDAAAACWSIALMSRSRSKPIQPRSRPRLPRLSLSRREPPVDGIRALNDTDLRALGRMHNTEGSARRIPDRSNDLRQSFFDLILCAVRDRIARHGGRNSAALEMAIDHLSLYQLTIEPGTRFGDLAARGRLRGLPDPGSRRRSLPHDSGDSVVRPACPPMKCRTMPKGPRTAQPDLLALGRLCRRWPRAHGRMTIDGVRWATETYPQPRSLARGRGVRQFRALGAGGADRAERAVEMLVMGLRLVEGIDLARYRALTGSDPRAAAGIARAWLDRAHGKPARSHTASAAA